MVQIKTRLRVLDNSGAKFAQCINVLKKDNSKFVFVGDIIVVSVKKISLSRQIGLNFLKRYNVIKGGIYKSVLVQITREQKIKDNSFVRFPINSVVLIDENNAIIGTRIKGFVSYSLRFTRWIKLLSLSKGAL
uniref:50S ribosomal protein L14 n=1 Tax=Cyanidium caldarium TaxID=2771 RepID=A0A7H0WBC2_CYACA|nr:50S ribosomal protein L14 [Cyanidium caldarium]QNR39851.1 50S ribosomal protein L14 [Cyanidium caldarium]